MRQVLDQNGELVAAQPRDRVLRADGVLQAHRRFAGPALAPLLSSLGVAASYLVFAGIGGARDVADLSTPAELEAAFREHARALADRAPVPGPRVVALDGKTLKRSFDHLNDEAAAHVLSAFAGEAALILARQEIAGGDEVAAARALIERLGLRGVLFTADALHCQKNVRLRDRDRQRAPGAGEGQPARPA